MKVKTLTGKMNDFGTKPRVKIMKHTGDAAILVYEGSPKNMYEEMQGMNVNSFTVLGRGYIEIHVK